MAKHLDVNAENSEQLYNVAKALASHQRIEILKLLYYQSLNVNEIAEKLAMPASSAAMHIRLLEAAGLINTESQPGTRGTMKLCNRKKDSITIMLNALPHDVREVVSYSIPVGSFTDCEIHPTCGIAGADGHIVNEDTPVNFYTPQRVNAKILWTSAGYLEYRIPNPTLLSGKAAARVSLCVEICSEAPNYREDWKSDITLWLNGVECGTWLSPGDFGSRRGRLNPEWWDNGTTQHGLLTTWAVGADGCFINGRKAGGATVDMLGLHASPFLSVRLGNRPDAENTGGMVIFGDRFGDYEQDIVFTLEY